ncbi:hypothetical protein H6F87_24870 [Cyanobacteria bacterium FACHB-502]|nr:hypothetical protein [Cyanobacteria bacterium FACHB-502]
MARDAIQSQLEATEVRIHNMDQRITEWLDHITETLETLGNRVDGLAVQVTQFNSGMTELKGLARQVLQAIDRQTESIHGHLQVAQQQSANISELAKLVATQASTVDFIIRRTSA